jgi:protease I
MSAEGKRAVFIIAHDKFRDEELFEPKKVLEDSGVEVVVASSSMDTAGGMLGATYKPDMLYEDINVEEFDAVVFIGGTGASEYWEDPKAHEIARKAWGDRKLVGAICIAPVTLAKAGLLSGKRATCFSSTRGDLESAGAELTGGGVARDGKIVTGEGPSAARAFGEEILRVLEES